LYDTYFEQNLVTRTTVAQPDSSNLRAALHLIVRIYALPYSCVAQHSLTYILKQASTFVLFMFNFRKMLVQTVGNVNTVY